MCMLRTAPGVALILLTSAPAFAQDAPLKLASLRLGVTDLAQSATFYAQHCGFDLAGDHSDEGFMVLVNQGVPLVLTRAESPIESTDQHCRVRFNFKTDDLDKQVAAMTAAGVHFVGAEQRSAVGRYTVFVDPSGNRHNMKQLNDQKAPLPRPAVYDVGVSVADMGSARAYYGGVLGFEPLTEKYYPPVVPYQQRGVTFFILSDAPGLQPATAAYGKTAWAGMAFEAPEIGAAMKSLRQAGVRFIDELPRRAGPVLCAAFVDPFGNPHELIEHVRAAPSAAPVTPDVARRAFERLKALAGDWQGRSTKGWTEKVNYSVIAGGSCVLESSFDAHPNERMLTLFHMDQDRLLLTHYCVAKNQPRLQLTAASADLSELTFTFLDATNLPSRDHGHMDKLVMNFGPDEGFSSRWTWYQDGKENWMEQIVHARATK